MVLRLRISVWRFCHVFALRNDRSKSIGLDPERKKTGKFCDWILNRRGYRADAVKEVFRIWDWQKEGSEQGPQTLGRTEELLGLEGARWLGPKSRLHKLEIKVCGVL